MAKKFDLQKYKENMKSTDTSNKIYVVYCIENKLNGKRYVGQTKDYKKRMKDHINGGGIRNNKCSLIHQAIKKYGKENFYFYVLVKHDNRRAVDILEQYYIQYYESFGKNGYNLTNGGINGVSGLSEESRKRIGEATRKRTLGKPSKLKGIPTGRGRKIKGTNIKTNEVVIFNTIFEASRTHKGLRNLHKALKGKRPTHRGFKWEYIENGKE